MSPDHLATVERLLKLSRAELEKNASDEERILFIRNAGGTKLECVFVLAALLDIGLGEANQRVHLSRTWADQWAEDEAQQLTLTAVLEEAGGNLDLRK